MTRRDLKAPKHELSSRHITKLLETPKVQTPLTARHAGDEGGETITAIITQRQWLPQKI